MRLFKMVDLEKKEEERKIKTELKKTEDVNPQSEDNTQKQGLKSKLDEVNEKLDLLTKRNKKLEQKEFRLPSKIKRGLKKLALKNKLFVLYLTRNRTMMPMICEIRDGFITINGMPYNASTDFVYLWKGKFPAAVIKEWDMQPVGTEDYYKAVEEKRTPEPISIAIRMMQSSENPLKKAFSAKAWIFIGLAIIAGLYVLIGGG